VEGDGSPVVIDRIGDAKPQVLFWILDGDDYLLGN
jgi:hypothetical protein